MLVDPISLNFLIAQIAYATLKYLKNSGGLRPTNPPPRVLPLAPTWGFAQSPNSSCTLRCLQLRFAAHQNFLQPCIMGDFNIDLLKPNSEFESSFYCNNMIPLISVATHEKQECKPSLFDNIFINTSDTLEIAGVLDNRVSHHSPIFCFLNHFNP